MQSFQLVILMLATSLFTSSSHLCLDLPFDLVDVGVHSYTFFCGWVLGYLMLLYHLQINPEYYDK